MSGFISQPVLPQYDKSKSQEDNWKELTRSIEAWSTSVVRSCNDAFQRDGSRVLKATSSTLTAGTTQFQDRALSLALNATFGGGSWKSHDTSRPSWALTLDMSLNRALIRRASATTGNLTWTTTTTLTHNSGLKLSANQSILDAVKTVITFDQIDFEDISGFATLASNGFTAPIDGTYEACAGLNYAANATGARFVEFAVDGASITPLRELYIQANTQGVDQLAALTSRFRLNAGQVVRVRGRQNSGLGAPGLAVLSGGSWFQLKLIGHS